MESIHLGNGGPLTSRLGYGCSRVMNSMNRSQSMKALGAAFDAGVRHFDTAIAYGFGDSEVCLGEFLQKRRKEVTITTKFGIAAGTPSRLFRIARAVSPLIQQLKALKGKAAPGPVLSSQAPESGRPRNPLFNAQQAKTSLESSLTRLRTDHIDLWLLHEARAADLPDDAENDPMLRVMEDAVREGKVGAFGVGSPVQAIPQLIREHKPYCSVTQYDWSVLDPMLPETPAFSILHGSLSVRFPALTAFLAGRSEQCKQWSDEVGYDLANPDMLSRLMVNAAIVCNPGSIVLFSSKRPDNIAANVAAGNDSSLAAASRRLYEIFQRDRALLS